MKKQLVFIMTDTQRYDMVNCYKETGLSTPCIDRLAASGVRYERAYTAQPVCGPARSCLFTGMFPACNGSWGNGMALGDNVKTIGQRLHDQGVTCAYIGKWHLDGTDYFGNGFCPDGWEDEYWYDMRRYLEEMSERDRMKSRIFQTMEYEELPDSFTYGSKVAAKALDFMEKHKDEDYLLVVSFDEPHFPFLCPPPYDHMYQAYEFPKNPAVYDTLEGKPGYQKVWAAEQPKPDRENLKIKSPYFFGCNSYVDELIGRVVDKVPDSAMIMYTSDHGDLLDSHCLFAKGPAAYEDVTRIPFIIRHPDGIHGGVYHRQPISHVSVCPTILEYFELPIPKLMQGSSILATSKDLNAPVDPYVFMEFGRFEQDHDHYGGFQLMRAITDERYKLSINLMSEDEFYDLQEDPYELHNLINDEGYEAERNRLHDALLDRMCRDRDPFRGYYWDNRPWRTDAKPANWRYRGYTRQRENEEYEPRQLDFFNGLVMDRPQRFKMSGRKIDERFSSLDEILDWMRVYDQDS